MSLPGLASKTLTAKEADLTGCASYVVYDPDYGQLPPVRVTENNFPFTPVMTTLQLNA
jgi:hypothetical protein